MLGFCEVAQGAVIGRRVLCVLVYLVVVVYLVALICLVVLVVYVKGSLGPGIFGFRHRRKWGVETMI